MNIKIEQREIDTGEGKSGKAKKARERSKDLLMTEN